MENFQYHMPTKVIMGRNCIKNNASHISDFGETAFIVTGRSSAKNGSLRDITECFESLGISYSIYDNAEENPSIESIQDTVDFAGDKAYDFVAAVGGGSSLDAGKASAVLLKNRGKTAQDLYSAEQLGALPVIAVPTTAGTGSEVTHNFVLTNHKLKTKSSTPQRVFPKIAFLDSMYMKDMPSDIMISTAIDALAHSIESYLSVSANFMSKMVAEKAFETFREVKNALICKEFDDSVLDKLLIISTLGGIAISQTATTIPHLLGYSLTYNKKIPHGRASGVFLYEYMASFKNRDKVNIIIDKLGFESFENFGRFLESVLYIDEYISGTEMADYADFAFSKKEKLKTHPEQLTLEAIREIYSNSIKMYSRNNIKEN